MFLMFGLLRPDVWPVGDYGIKVAVKEQLKLRSLPDAKKLTAVGERWKPYRTVAAWYLWRTLDKEYRAKE
jgi:DNA-3-methyladenine glycosylase II